MIQYTPIEQEVDEKQVFLIQEGEFKGVTFTFGAVQFIPPAGGFTEENSEPEQVKFSFDVTGGPDELSKEVCEASPEFQGLIADILCDFLQKQLDEGNYKIGPMDETSAKLYVG